MLRLVVTFCAAALALCSAPPVRAQTTYGYGPLGDFFGMMLELDQRCHAGEFVTPEPLLAEIRASAHQTMLRYMQLASASDRADVTAAYSRSGALRSWSSQGTFGEPRAVDDPIARRLATEGLVLAPPEHFVRGSRGNSAVGQWRVRDANDPEHILAVYQSAFRRERGVWVLTQVTLWMEGVNAPAPFAQYCDHPGDRGRVTEVDKPIEAPVEQTE
ncbi:MAG: hypothetical protein AB7J28_13250 [Hyphomonadaceae bacterium]